jgi:hypothetical protein
MTAVPAPAFSARDVFDPKGFYNRLRSGFQPELKLRGLFYELQALREAKGRSRVLAAAPDRGLVLYTDDPGRPIDASVTAQFLPAGAGTKRLLLSVEILEETDYPAPQTQCRAFLLTQAMIERLCGPRTSPPTARIALQRLFPGEGEAEPGQIARVLAAVPEMSGEFGPGGKCILPRSSCRAKRPTSSPFPRSRPWSS